MYLLNIRGKSEQNSVLKYKNEIVEIPIDKIKSSPYQTRTHFDEQALLELSRSIKENGLLQPITVMKAAPMGYVLIAGERRLRAFKIAGQERIPAIIYSAKPKDLALLSYIENSLRSELSVFEQAEAIRQFIITFACTQQEAAQQLHMSQSAVANKLRLLALTPEQRKLCIEGGLTERHARAMLRLNSISTQTNFLETVVAKNLNVQEAERLVDRYLATPVLQKKKSVPVVRDVRLFINTITRAIDIMKSSGINAEAIKTQDDKFIQYLVRIPIETTTTTCE